MRRFSEHKRVTESMRDQKQQLAKTIGKPGTVQWLLSYHGSEHQDGCQLFSQKTDVRASWSL